MDGLKPSYDVIVLGTGATESLAAGAIARAGIEVLHIDKRPYYGATHATLSLSEFINMLTEQQKLNGAPEALLTNVVVEGTPGSAQALVKAPGGRRYNIDISPKLLWSQTSMIDVLVRSGVNRYLEFKSFDQCLMFLDGELQQVPCSKSDVFKNKYISLKEKRQLMKFLSTITGPSEEDKQILSEYSQKPFYKFLAVRQLSAKLIAFILYAIAMIEYSQEDGAPAEQIISTSEGMARIQRFMFSLGKYGNTPFLVPLYGTSEIVQAYCRLGAVFGATYCLSYPITKILPFEDGSTGIVDGSGNTIKSKWVISNIEHSPQSGELESYTVSRCIAVVDRPVLGEEPLVVLTFPPGSVARKGATASDNSSNNSNNNNKSGKNNATITAIQYSDGTMTCPNGLFLVHFMMRSTGAAQDDLEPLIEQLFNTKPVPSPTPATPAEKPSAPAEATTTPGEQDKKEEPKEEKKEEAKKEEKKEEQKEGEEEETEKPKPTPKANLRWCCYFNLRVHKPKITNNTTQTTTTTTTTDTSTSNTSSSSSSTTATTTPSATITGSTTSSDNHLLFATGADSSFDFEESLRRAEAMFRLIVPTAETPFIEPVPHPEDIIFEHDEVPTEENTTKPTAGATANNNDNNNNNNNNNANNNNNNDNNSNEGSTPADKQ